MWCWKSQGFYRLIWSQSGGDCLLWAARSRLSSALGAWAPQKRPQSPPTQWYTSSKATPPSRRLQLLIVLLPMTKHSKTWIYGGQNYSCLHTPISDIWMFFNLLGQALPYNLCMASSSIQSIKCVQSHLDWIFPVYLNECTSWYVARPLDIFVFYSIPLC